jgi:hypothetical protein
LNLRIALTEREVVKDPRAADYSREVCKVDYAVF